MIEASFWEFLVSFLGEVLLGAPERLTKVC